MKRFFALCCGSLLVVLLLGVAVRAEEITNKYFTLDLPSGWNVEISQEVGEKDVLVVFFVTDSSRKNLVNITVTPLKEPSSAKEVCTILCDAQKAKGVHIGEPVATGESYVVAFSQGETNGLYYFTVTGTLASTVTVVGDGGKELLQKHFKPVDPKLFPASYEGVPIRPQ